MLHIEDNPDNYKTLKISIEATTIKSEMLKFLPDHLKLEMCQNAVKKLPFVIRYVPDWCKTQKLCDKVILKNIGTLNFVPDCYKNKKNL